jgi:hypothetical protein
MRFRPGEPIVEAHGGGSLAKFAVALVLVALTLITATASAGPGRAAFNLVFEGSRIASPQTEKFALGFRDEGPFSALAPMCDKGYAADIEHVLTEGWVSALRRFDCGNGESIVARTWRTAGDRSWGYEEGAWLIVAGTGAYETLRGKGTYVRAFREDAPAWIAEVWRGVVDFDVVPPQVTVTRVSVAAPRRPRGAHVVRLTFSARDASGGPVSFLATARSSTLLGAKYGIAGSGETSVVLSVRPRAGERAVRLEIVATDEVGNERTIVRLRALPPAA